jgi:hypothetical protein
MIQPGAIAQFTGDPGALETAITKLAAAGREIVNVGAAIDTTWQRLDAVYDAPEAGPLFAATSRVRDNAANLGEDVEAVARVLTTYLAEVQGVAAKLADLKTAAVTFVAGSQSDPDWRENGQKVDQHNDLVRQVDVETAALMAAERKAANAIYALIGGPEYHDVAGTPFSYGFDAGNLASDGDRPWGDPVDRERPWWIDVSAGAYNLSKGIVWDGVINGDLRGLANLFGYFGEGWLEDGKVFDLETAKETWTGLGMLAWALAGNESMRHALDGVVELPGRQERMAILQSAGLGFVGVETGKENIPRGAGEGAYNVLSSAVPPAKIGALGKLAAGAAKAATLVKLAEAAGSMSDAGRAARLVRLTSRLDDVLNVLRE